MKKFIGKMLTFGVELDKAETKMEEVIVINDVELLYKSHIDSLYNGLLRLTMRHKVIMDKKNIVIQIYPNATGFLWSMSKLNTGTDLGWSDFNGDHKASRTFTTYEKALEDAIDLVDKCDLERFVSDTPETEFHWGLYAGHLNSKYRK